MHSNNYIIMFSLGMVVICSLLLVVVSEYTKPLIKLNQKEEKQKNILAAAKITDYTDLQAAYSKYVEEIIINKNGEKVENPTLPALKIDLTKDKRKLKRNPDYDIQYPLYVVTKPKGEKIYVMELSGVGLWGPIWGYIGLKDDFNRVFAAIFDHKTETPGLGAEINTDWFEKQFSPDTVKRKPLELKYKKIFNSKNEFAGIDVAKKSDKSHEIDNRVDAISGATITGDGVAVMIQEDISFYLNYLKK